MPVRMHGTIGERTDGGDFVARLADRHRPEESFDLLLPSALHVLSRRSSYNLDARTRLTDLLVPGFPAKAGDLVVASVAVSMEPNGQTSYIPNRRWPEPSYLDVVMTSAATVLKWGLA